MRHEKRSSWISNALEVGALAEEDVEDLPASAGYTQAGYTPRRLLVNTPDSLPECVEDLNTTATPSGSSSNLNSRRSSDNQPDDLHKVIAEDAGYVVPVPPPSKVHRERQRDFRPRRLIGLEKASSLSGSNTSLPNVFSTMTRGQYSDSSEPDSARSWRSRSSSAADSSLGPLSAGSSVTPRQRRRRSRSGSSFEGGCLAELRDHLHHYIKPPPVPSYHDLHGIHGRGAVVMPGRPGTPASPGLRPSGSPWQDCSRGMSLSASASALLSPSDGSTLIGKGKLNRGLDDVHAVKLPQLKHSESAPVFHEPGLKGASRRSSSNTSFKESSLYGYPSMTDKDHDDLETVDLEPLLAGPSEIVFNSSSMASTRPTTAWTTTRPTTMGGLRPKSRDDPRRPRTSPHGAHRPNTRGHGRDGLQPEPQRNPTSNRPSTRGSGRDGWQLSLCQRVAIHCPSSLPSKETFAQRKVPRPVSRGDSRPTSPEREQDRPSWHDSIGDKLQNMRRQDSDSDSGSNSAEITLELS